MRYVQRDIQIAFLWATHIFDATVTAAGLHNRVVTELNPLLAHMWDFHPVNFFITKFSLLLLGTGVAIHHWRDKRMRIAVYGLNAIMLCVVYYQICNLLGFL